jgi:hypothetical protein
MTKPLLIGLTGLAGSGDVSALHKRVHELLSYEPRFGYFFWKINRGSSKAGDVAGSVCPDGYRLIKVDGKSYKAHRLAWLMTHGEWPAEQIDHINGVRTDNRIVNLREASKKQNLSLIHI